MTLHYLIALITFLIAAVIIILNGIKAARKEMLEERIAEIAAKPNPTLEEIKLIETLTNKL